MIIKQEHHYSTPDSIVGCISQALHRHAWLLHIAVNDYIEYEKIHNPEGTVYETVLISINNKLIFQNRLDSNILLIYMHVFGATIIIFWSFRGEN